MARLSSLNSPNGKAVVATRSAPPIPGLFFDPTLRLPDDLAEEVMLTCMQMYFRSPDVDQIMLFERAGGRSSASCLPPILNTLLSSLSTLLRPFLPPSKHALLFPSSPTPYARQAILNLYWPGDGITPHVDLLDRYGDGIIGRAEEIASGEAEGCGVYLPPGSVIVMTEEARYGWTHGIETCMEDLVESESEADSPAVLSRDVRLSVTFRWLLPGADVVGGTGSHKSNSVEMSS
ncbi:hypothetical protein DAEQUDRAFT_667957 [Daedalea quercina L-15889]|uniref:Fe2OG dioxygenase domain-containing protein n=1 Tax=Daedalea quercina L-15889 TaxID=1314783 RepID=A0A165R4N1_9APHY|nr:hypothetical protein DAEQUDRAFT_667957 [Daedalea quercina L-15889]